jgi:hypothetical protein
MEFSDWFVTEELLAAQGDITDDLLCAVVFLRDRLRDSNVVCEDE